MLKNRLIPFLALAALVPFAVRAQVPGSGPAAPAAPTPAPAPEPPAEPPTEAEKVLDQAIKTVAALKAVATDIAQQVEMLGQKFRVEGRYLRAPENRVYLKLTVKGLADSTGTTLQVCDGQTLWNYQQILEAQVYRKVGKIPQILEKLNAPDIDPKLHDLIVTQYLQLAGPDALLTGLRKSIRFEQKEEGTLDGKPVWVLRGIWKNREGLLGPNQQPLSPFAPLPAYIPSVISVWVGKEDGWPYKLQMEGQQRTILEDTRPRGPDGRPIGPVKAVQKVPLSKVELLYTNVRINPTLKVEEFAFQAPPGARVQDETDAILGRLEQELQMAAAKKKATAAEGKSEDSTLQESITVPRPPGAPQ